MTTLRTETRNGVRHLVLCRAAEYNTITPELRDELAAAIDAADADRDVRVILLRAEGRAFCAGYGLDWSTAAEAQQRVYSEAEPPHSSVSLGGAPASGAAVFGGGARSEPQASEVHQVAASGAAVFGGGARSEPQASEVHQDAASGAAVRGGGARSEVKSAEPSEAHEARRRPPANPDRPEADSALAGNERRVWDSVADLGMMSRFVETYLKLWYAKKPTIAAVQGWCVGGGTDMVLCADLIVAGDDASFGYPPARVWGTPTTAMWVYRMGLERAKRYLLTGDEIPAKTAAEIGLVLEVVPAAELESHATALAERMARLPLSQLVMLKLLCNQTVENMGFASSRLLGTLFDGVARHTQEGLDFVRRSQQVGFRQAVRERDDPFEDYGSRPKR